MVYLYMTAVALAVVLVWYSVCVPLVCRLFGIHLPYGRKAQSVARQLTLAQRVFITGVLSYGVGMYIFMTVSAYVEGRLTGNPMSASRWVTSLVWVGAGALLGLLCGATEPHEK